MEGGGRIGQLLEWGDESRDARLEVDKSRVEIKREGFVVSREEAVDDGCAGDLAGET